MKDTPYYHQVRLLLQVLPHIGKEPCFALKGGTAINLFIRDMPRLSVDIDLTYMPIESRDQTLANINDALARIAEAIEKTIPGTTVQKVPMRGTSNIIKLVVGTQQAQIKVEPNVVLRGSVFECEERDLCKHAEETFEVAVSCTTLANADLYGGKLCAGLDRQHPRDLFDIKTLFEHEGMTDDIRKAFIVYLISHDRPMNELLNPTLKEFKQVYENEFQGMSRLPVDYDELVDVRKKLLTSIKSEFTDNEKAFIISVKQGQPDWDLMGIPGIENLPAIQWKLQNIQQMGKQKHEASLDKLRDSLGV